MHTVAHATGPSGVRNTIAVLATGAVALLCGCVSGSSGSDIVSWRAGERVEFLGRSAVVMQQQANDCGLAALATLAGRLDVALDPSAFLAHVPDDSTGADMLLLRDIAAVHGLLLRGVFDRSRAGRFNVPWIAHLRYGNGHFVVVEAADSDHLTIADPALGRLRVRQSVFRRHWSGSALIVERRSKR